MIARATYGNFEIFERINHYLKTGQLLPEHNLNQKIEDLKEYASKLVFYKGEEIAMKELRGQAGWFIKGCRNSAMIRNELSHLREYSDLLDILNKVEKELFN